MIEFTQGDTALLSLTAENGMGVPVDLTGATLTTYFRDAQGTAISFPNSQHTINPDQVNFRGKYTLSLIIANTDSVPAGTNKEIITKVVIGPSTIYYHGPSMLTVLGKIPVS